MIMILEPEVDQIESFLKRALIEISHREYKDTIVKLLAFIKDARGGYAKMQ